MQPFEEINKQYEKPDPWGYQTNPEDIKRKAEILNACELIIPSHLKQFESVLDVGCGEGWITQDLPADSKYGFEISKNARSRWPECIQPMKPCTCTHCRFDLVVATGVLYAHYDYETMFKLLLLSEQFVLTCNIKDWEVTHLVAFMEISGFKEMMHYEFPYREYIQKLRVFKKI